MRAGVDRFLDSGMGLWNSITGNDGYVPTSVAQYVGALAREHLEDNGPKVLGSSLGQWGYDLAHTFGNMGAKIGAGAINPLLGAVLGGVDAGGNAYTEMINEGYSKTQAGNYAALIGCSEAGLSYLLGGIGKLGGKFTDEILDKLVDKVDNILGKVAIKLGGKVIAEVGEENLQAILGPWYKELTTHIKQEKPGWEEIAYNSLLTAITTLLLEGKGAVKSAKASAEAGKVGWDGRVVVKDATGKSITMDGKKYEFLGYDEKGSPVYQDVEVLASDTNLKIENGFKNINPKESIAIVEKDSTIQIDNKAVRQWYHDNVAKIKEGIDPRLPVEEQARQAFEERNRIRTEARNRMLDQETRKMLDSKRPNLTLEELIESKMRRKSMTRAEAIQDILETSTKTNENVDRELGIGGK